MSWVYYRATTGMRGHHVMRAGNMPLIALYKEEQWRASLLETCQCQAQQAYYPGALTVDEARNKAERDLQKIGWRWDNEVERG